MNLSKASIWWKYGYVWVTLVLFLGSLIGHWMLAWFAYVDEAAAHGESIEVAAYLFEVGRDTLENWQSEFLQLMWQVAGLAFLFYIGSPQSKEEDERLEEKLDLILRAVSKDADQDIKRLDEHYARTG